MTFTLWSPARYALPLPEGHRFPAEKYAMLRDRIVAEGVAPAAQVRDPDPAGDELLRLVHTADYVERITRGTLGAAEERRLGFPWSPQLVERSRRTVGGTIAAARHALTQGVAMNLAGGTHHAFPDHGEGFCVFNDVGITIRLLQREGSIHRAAVIDLDVHQGNGTHAVFTGDRSVFTFSMHGAHNYPFRPMPEPSAVAPGESRWGYAVRVPGTLDIELPDGTGDAEYLDKLENALPQVLRAAQPDVVFFLAGADPHEGDRLGRMKLTFVGLERRDSLVIQACREVGLPMVAVIAGGYGRDITDTVRVHTATARILGEYA
jgi:acetoin utilization deacetylase AcuC-like enzyme